MRIATLLASILIFVLQPILQGQLSLKLETPAGNFDSLNSDYVGYVTDSDGVKGLWFSGPSAWVVAQKDLASHWHKLSDIEFISISHTTVTAELMEYVCSLEQVKSIYISCDTNEIEIRPDSLTSLSKMQWLKRLHLVVDEGISAANLSFLSSMTNLEDLELRGGVTKKVLKYLEGLKLLRRLALGHVTTNRNPQTFLSQMEHLESLQVTSTDSIVDLLSNAQTDSIKTLSLGSKEIHQEDFEIISRLKNLEELRLDAAAIHSDLLINKMRNLKVLSLRVGERNKEQE